jgi:hypothetical protein
MSLKEGFGLCSQVIPILEFLVKSHKIDFINTARPWDMRFFKEKMFSCRSTYVWQLATEKLA